MAKITLNDISAGYGSTTVINANNAAIEAAMENTLSRDGTGPNTMLANLDMNSNRITNLGAPTSVNDAVRLGDLDGTYDITINQPNVAYTNQNNTFTGNQTISLGTPWLGLRNTAAATNGQYWLHIATGNQYSIRAYDDALTGQEYFILATRDSGTTNISNLAFAADSIDLNGPTDVNGNLVVSGTTTAQTINATAVNVGGNAVYHAGNLPATTGVTKFTTVSQTVNAGTALADDNELINWSVTAGQAYRFWGVLRVSSVTGAGFAYDMNPASGSMTTEYYSIVGAEDEQAWGGNGVSNCGITTSLSIPVINFWVHGYFVPTATTTVNLRWGQNQTIAGNTIRYAQSWITVAS